jgi:hypothetical protein
VKPASAEDCATANNGKDAQSTAAADSCDATPQKEGKSIILTMTSSGIVHKPSAQHQRDVET